MTVFEINDQDWQEVYPDLSPHQKIDLAQQLRQLEKHLKNLGLNPKRITILLLTPIPKVAPFPPLLLADVKDLFGHSKPIWIDAMGRAGGHPATNTIKSTQDIASYRQSPWPEPRADAKITVIDEPLRSQLYNEQGLRQEGIRRLKQLLSARLN